MSSIASAWFAALIAQDASVDLSAMRQSITGFGASSAWTLTNASDALADQLFSADAGIGLSLLRIRIAPAGNTSELVTAQKAVARGARVWASPWTPPGAWKDNGSDTNGGSLLAANYQMWADRLATFARTMQSAGIPLLMLSVQNEPNWTAEWETCRWTNTQLTTFIRANLGPALQAQGVTAKLLAPETIDWDSLQSYGNSILGDATASGFIGAIATHGYGGTAFNYAAAAQNGKEFWITELDDDTTGAYDATITGGLRVANLIHSHLTVANANAWHYWWLAPDSAGPTNAALTDGTTLGRRAHVMGNWSKFVRPGFVRIEATAAPQSNVQVTAFRNPANPRLVIVAVNQGTGATTQRFVLTGGSPGQVTPWVTSASAALASQAAVTVSGAAFSYSLPARSVTTFVGDLPGGSGTGGMGGGGAAGAGGRGGAAGAGAGAGGRGGAAGGAAGAGGGGGASGGAGAGGGGRGGAAGGSGAAGAGGGTGTTGLAGTTGEAGSTGAAGTTATGGGGTTGVAGTTGGDSPSGGCACAVEANGDPAGAAWLAMLAAIWIAGVGRRRRQRRAVSR
jgi:glucuronoarabinoxylan endo-1,4-beta-xylanase